MNWPQIPQSFEGMSSEALYALANEIQAARAAALPNLTTEDEAEYDEYTAKERRIRSFAADVRGTEVAADEKAAAEEAARVAAEAAASPEPDPEPEPDDDEITDPAPAELATVAPGAPAVVTTMSSGATRVREVDRRASRWVSTGIAGPDKGHNFESNLELAQTIQDMSGVVEAGSDKKHYIGKIYDTFSEDRILDANKPWTSIQNLYDASDDTLEAAFCPPATPIYDLACENSTRRPVLTGLPGFRTPERGAFTVLASPTLSSITGGYGQWTSEDDADPEALKEACQTISCVNPSTFEIYGIYRCLTVKNLMQMTFPELVAAYLNRLQAAAARYAEILLLEAMGTASTLINTPALGYNATTTIVGNLLNYLALYQEQERWDAPQMDVWLPRWVAWAIKTDMLRRRRTDGGRNLVASDGEVNSLFTDAGFSPHWFMDRPSWAAVIPSLRIGNTLSLFPQTVDMLVHKRGKFATMSRGELSIGVTGNNMYRLEDDLRRNQFTFFFENFEGLIDTDSCPAHKLHMPVCWSGVQIADDVIDCEGNRYLGVASGT